MSPIAQYRFLASLRVRSPQTLRDDSLGAFVGLSGRVCGWDSQFSDIAKFDPATLFVAIYSAC